MMSGKKVIVSLIALASLSFLLLGCERGNPTFVTEYQAVFMDNGQVFFGKIENVTSAYPLLQDVYYIGKQQSPDGKEVRSILVKRGNEWHAPKYMYINRSHIALIEPVSPNSRVAQLIKEAKAQQPQPQATQPQ